jgi:hypothetical protein
MARDKQQIDTGPRFLAVNLKAQLLSPLKSRLAFNLLLADFPHPKAFNTRVEAINRVGEFNAKETGHERKLG